MKEVLDKKSVFAVVILASWFFYSNLSLPKYAEDKEELKEELSLEQNENAEENNDEEQAKSLGDSIIDSMGGKFGNLIPFTQKENSFTLNGKSIDQIAGIEIGEFVSKTSESEARDFLDSAEEEVARLIRCTEKLCYAKEDNLALRKKLIAVDLLSSQRSIRNNNLSDLLVEKLPHFDERNQENILSYLTTAKNPEVLLNELRQHELPLSPFALKKYFSDLGESSDLQRTPEIGELYHALLVKQALNSDTGNALVLLKELRHSPHLAADMDNISESFCRIRNKMHKRDRASADASLYIGMRLNGLRADDFPSCT